MNYVHWRISCCDFENMIALIVFSGLVFEQTVYTVEEDAGTVQLCITYGGDNVDQSVTATVGPGKYVECIIMFINEATFIQSVKYSARVRTQVIARSRQSGKL